MLDLPPELEEEAAGALGRESLGVEVSRSPDGRSRLRVFVGSRAEAAALLDLASTVLRAVRLAPASCGARIEPVEDGRWAERYQEQLRPFPLGSRFLVVPDGRPHHVAGRVGIFLVPGRAFGTGEHPTTRLCAESLERLVRTGSRWLDLGCGSGILSVVAARCGATQVFARDVDEEAVEVARETMVANRVEREVDVAVGSANELTDAGLDGVVANIASSYFLLEARVLRSVVRPGGLLVASGFLVEEADAVETALELLGARVEERLASGEWAASIATCDGPSVRS